MLFFVFCFGFCFFCLWNYVTQLAETIFDILKYIISFLFVPMLFLFVFVVVGFTLVSFPPLQIQRTWSNQVRKVYGIHQAW